MRPTYSAHSGHQATCAAAPTTWKAVYDLGSNGIYGRVLAANLPVRLQQFCKGWMSGVMKHVFGLELFHDFFFRTMPTLSVGGPDPAVFPNNSNFRSHYKEFVVHGYRSSYEAIQCKFPLADSNRVLLDWSTGFVDGMTKIMLCLCIIGFCEELEFTDEQLRDPDLRRTLDSFGAFRCSYQHFDNQGHHFLNAISFPALLQVVALFLSDWVVAPSQACFCCL